MSVGSGVNLPATKVLLQQLPPLFASRGSGGLTAALVLSLVASMPDQGSMHAKRLQAHLALGA
ncbi:MAG: hypothetical protein ABIZ18_00450 [Caldimonas sp.]